MGITFIFIQSPSNILYYIFSSFVKYTARAHTSNVIISSYSKSPDVLLSFRWTPCVIFLILSFPLPILPTPPTPRPLTYRSTRKTNFRDYKSRMSGKKKKIVNRLHLARSTVLERTFTSRAFRIFRAFYKYEYQRIYLSIYVCLYVCAHRGGGDVCVCRFVHIHGGGRLSLIDRLTGADT